MSQYDPDDDFDDGGDVEQTIECPYCGRTIHEDAQQCPGCGNFISEEDSPPQRKPWWIVVGVLICLFLVYQWIRGGF